MIDEEVATVVQPRDEAWNKTSDHNFLLYKLRDEKLRTGKCRTSKLMLKNIRNKEEYREIYRQNLPCLIEEIKRDNQDTVQRIYSHAVKAITDPWSWMERKRPQNRSPHWTANLNCLWKAGIKAKRRAKDHCSKRTGTFTEKEGRGVPGRIGREGDVSSNGRRRDYVNAQQQ